MNLTKIKSILRTQRGKIPRSILISLLSEITFQLSTGEINSRFQEFEVIRIETGQGFFKNRNIFYKINHQTGEIIKEKY